MAEASILPDAPFRSGITGKYKLLIKSVTSTPINYEYELVDADGNIYKAGHPKHFTEDEILRCMVYFKIENAKHVVTDTLICNKQDLASAIPALSKKQSRPIIKTKDTIAQRTNSADGIRALGDPSKTGKSGLYHLSVIGRDSIGDKYSYTVKDAEGRKYKVETQVKRCIKIGSIHTCQVIYSKEQGCEFRVRVVAICKSPKSDKKPVKKFISHHVKRGRSATISSDWLSTPCVGDHFHLIYTPMGNKR